MFGARWVRRDITLVIEDVLERYQETQRRRAGGDIPALQVHNLDFSYGTQPVLFDVNLQVEEGEIAALLGTNGAGKSTLLRAVAGLDHPTRGAIRLFGTTSTYLEAEQILGLGVGLLVGGKMTFPSLTVRENLRLAAFSFRHDRTRATTALDEALDAFPALVPRLDQPAGTLSGGEQQMLALSRVLLTRPRLLLVDELTLGLAPRTVEDLIGIIRRVNADGTTVLLVEQSVNLALSLAEHSFFLERGEVRFDGPTVDLLARDDLLRPVFLPHQSAVPSAARPTRAPSRRAARRAPTPPGRRDDHPLQRRPGSRARARVRAPRARARPDLPHEPRPELRARSARGRRGRPAPQAHRATSGSSTGRRCSSCSRSPPASARSASCCCAGSSTRPRVLMMVATIGLSQVLFLLTLLPFVAPKDLFVPYPLPFDWTLHIGGGILQPGEVATLIVAPLVALGLALFLRYSPWGLAMRAMSENTDSARLSGVWVRRMSTLAWMIAGLLSAITAILDAPGQSSALKEALPPGLLLRALAAALIAGMASFGVAFLAGIGIGIVEQVLNYNLVGDEHKTAEIILWLLVLIMVVLVVRVRRLQRGPRTEERSSWASGGESGHFVDDRLRQWVGRAGVGALLTLAAFLPLVVSPGRSFLLARVCLYAVIALSLTVLTGWAGQVSLGQFGLVAVGAVTASQLGDWNLVLLIPFTGLVTAIIAILVGLPALRIRGLYLAVTTLGFALFMQQSVLSTPCWKAPIVGTEVCTGLPDPASTLVHRPSFLGLSLASDQSFAWFSLGVLLVFLVIVRTWRDRGIARRLIAVRDNEAGAAAMGVAVVRTKLLAFGLSGFMAGCAGVCLAFALERFQPSDFSPAESVLVLSMVVVGGLGSVLGAVLGALYLVGLPAALGSTSTVQFVTSGFGVLAFLLYLPGGLARDRTRVRRRRHESDRAPPGPAPGGRARGLPGRGGGGDVSERRAAEQAASGARAARCAAPRAGQT